MSREGRYWVSPGWVGNLEVPASWSPSAPRDVDVPRVELCLRCEDQLAIHSGDHPVQFMHRAGHQLAGRLEVLGAVSLDSVPYWSYIPEIILESHGKTRGHPSAKTVVSYENRGQLEAHIFRVKQRIPCKWFLYFIFIEATQ